MVKSKDQFLKELTRLEELKENVIAYVFAENPDLDISNKAAFFDNVKRYFFSYLNNLPSGDYNFDFKDEIDEWEGLDLRIKNVRLKSVKGFPNNSVPYGINFSSDDSPQSMVILGGNASGKSSIYDALEYVFCDEIGEAKLRDYRIDLRNEQDRYKDFLQHFDSGFDQSYCEVQLVDRILDFTRAPNIPDSVKSKINPGTHFISDFDVYSNGKLDFQGSSEQSFHNQIARSMGLSDLLDFNRNLKSFISYQRRKETSDINIAAEKIKNEERFVENNRKTIDEHKSTLSRLKKDQRTDDDARRKKKIAYALDSIREERLHFSFSYENWTSARREFDKYYKDYVELKQHNLGLNELQFLNLGLDLLKEYEDCPFCESSHKLPHEIEIQARERAEKIRDLNDAMVSLNKSRDRLEDEIMNLNSQITNFRGNLKRELSSIQESELTELNELSKLENDFSEYLSKLSSTDFFRSIGEMKDTPTFINTPNEYIANILENNIYNIQQLSEIESKVKEFTDQRTKIREDVEASIQEKPGIKTYDQQVIELNKAISDLEIQIKEANSRIENERKIIAQLEEVKSQFSLVKNSTAEYERIVSNEINRMVRDSFAPIKLVVEEVLEKYFEYDGRKLELIVSQEVNEVDESTGEILSEIIVAKVKPKNENVEPQSIGKVLNTFHYRLFSTMVGISIAIASRKNTKINLPLVLDDIFYASDFENRAMVETFIEVLFEMFKEFTPEMPLQLILFTHDQLIFESTVKTLNNSSSNGDSEVAFAKLFPFTEAKNDGDFCNLIYKFPSYYSSRLLSHAKN